MSVNASTLMSLFNAGMVAAYNFTPANSARLVSVLNDGGVIGCIGNSITVGYGAQTAGSTNPTDGAQPNSWPAVLAANLNSFGINAQQTALWADANRGSAGSFLYDPRVTLGSSNWAPFTATAGGNLWRNSADTTAFRFHPAFNSDTAKVWYQRNTGLATWKCEVGGVQISSDITAGSTLGNAVLSQTFTTTLADNAWDFSRISGGALNVIGMESYDSTIPNLVRIWNMGFSGSKTSSWIDTANPTRSGSVLQILPYDVVVVGVERNDCDDAVPLTTYHDNLTTLGGFVVTAGAAPILATEPPQNPGGANPSNATQETYDAVVQQVAEENNWPWFSQRCWFGRTYAANSQYFYDSTHPNASGYGFLAGHVASLARTQKASA